MKTAAKIVRKKVVSPIDTLRGFEVGQTSIIKTADLKGGVIRGAAKQLALKGYEYCVTEKGLINEVCVTRIK